MLESITFAGAMEGTGIGAPNTHQQILMGDIRPRRPKAEGISGLGVCQTQGMSGLGYVRS